jgi:RNA polymerase sigma factor for flagellar operon FliA
MMVELGSPGSGLSSDRERLILENLPQVRSIARRIHEKLPPNVTMEDLISAGIIGLIQAVDNFDDQQNVKFRTYAEYKIRGAILDSLRDLDWASRLQRKKAKAIESAISAVQGRLMRVPTEEEIAQQLGVPLTEYYEWLVETQGLTLGSLDAQPLHNSKTTLLEYIVDDEAKQPGYLLEQQEMETMLASAISKLPQIERTILSLYYEGDLAPREISQVVDLPAARVCQLRTQAVLRLRAHAERVLSARKKKK